MNGYHEGHKVLHVSIIDNVGMMEDITTKIYESWNENCQIGNDSFGSFLSIDKDLSVFQGKMF